MQMRNFPRQHLSSALKGNWLRYLTSFTKLNRFSPPWLLFKEARANSRHSLQLRKRSSAKKKRKKDFAQPTNTRRSVRTQEFCHQTRTPLTRKKSYKLAGKSTRAIKIVWNYQVNLYNVQRNASSRFATLDIVQKCFYYDDKFSIVQRWSGLFPERCEVVNLRRNQARSSNPGKNARTEKHF